MIGSWASATLYYIRNSVTLRGAPRRLALRGGGHVPMKAGINLKEITSMKRFGRKFWQQSPLFEEDMTLHRGRIAWTILLGCASAVTGVLVYCQFLRPTPTDPVNLVRMVVVLGIMGGAASLLGAVFGTLRMHRLQHRER